MGDVGVSKDLNENFKKHMVNSDPLDIDFSIQVLSSGSWPFQQSCVFSLPAELELVTNCFKNKYTLQASTFQMSVLLAFNEADSWTVAKLAEATQIKMDILI